MGEYQVDDDDLTADEVIVEGVVAQFTGNILVGRWQRRMAQLTALNFSLFREKLATPVLAMPVEKIDGCKEVATSNPKEHQFQVTYLKKDYLFRCEHRAEMRKWVACIEAAKSVFERGEDEDDEAENALSKTHFDELELSTVEVAFHENCGPDLNLTPSQWRRMFGPVGAANPTLLTDLFRVMDTNHDGLLSKAEFLLGMSTLLKGTFDEKLELAWQLMDRNNDGVVSYEELCRAIRQQMCAAARLIAMVMDISDQQESGKGKHTQVVVPDIPDDRVPVKQDDVSNAARAVVDTYGKEVPGFLSKKDFRRWARKDPKYIPVLSGEFDEWLKPS